FFFIAGVTALLAISCNKETTEVASSKANAKTEEVSFSVGISQEDTKAYLERTGAKEWTAKFDNDKIWVEATDGSGTVLSSSEFTGGDGWSYPQNVFKGEWTYPEKETTYSVFYPSSLGKDGILDLRHQNPYSGGLGKIYALRCDVKGVESGEFPKSIVLNPLVAVLVVFRDGPLDLIAKDSKGAFVTGIDADGKVISSSEISSEEAVLFSTGDLPSIYSDAYTYGIIVPANEKLTFYNGEKELETTKDSGLKEGTFNNLFIAEEIRVNIEITDIDEDEYSATVFGRVQTKGSGIKSLYTQFYFSNIRESLLGIYAGTSAPSSTTLSLDENGCFSVSLSDLTESKTYYFLVRVIMTGEQYTYKYFSDIISFTTLEPRITVETRAPKFVGATEAILDSYVVTSTFEGEGRSFAYSSTATTRDEIIASGKGCGKTVTGLEMGTTYYYVAVGSAGSGRGVPKKVAYGDVMSFTTLSSEAEVGEAVDLGLSVLWRSCNLGTALPTTPGNTYSWGETSEPLSGDKYNKYRGDGGKEVLDLEDDAAHYVLGGKWRMPTYAEIEEMKSKCTLTAITYYSSDGTPPHFIIRSNVRGYTDKYIVLPVVGHTEEIRVWTSSLIPFDPYSDAFICAFSDYSTGFNIISGSRNSKYYIRPVLEK
ncbi:MAG: hypothetical protein IJU69_05030, partial [Bacteroidales bacterium]|nr:hypothetical protein [Bacteroidales bacterium]